VVNREIRLIATTETRLVAVLRNSLYDTSSLVTSDHAQLHWKG